MTVQTATRQPLYLSSQAVAMGEYWSAYWSVCYRAHPTWPMFVAFWELILMTVQFMLANRESTKVILITQGLFQYLYIRRTSWN